MRDAGRSSTTLPQSLVNLPGAKEVVKTMRFSAAWASDSEHFKIVKYISNKFHNISNTIYLVISCQRQTGSDRDEAVKHCQTISEYQLAEPSAMIPGLLASIIDPWHVQTEGRPMATKLSQKCGTINPESSWILKSSKSKIEAINLLIDQCVQCRIHHQNHQASSAIFKRSMAFSFSRGSGSHSRR